MRTNLVATKRRSLLLLEIRRNYSGLEQKVQPLMSVVVSQLIQLLELQSPTPPQTTSPLPPPCAFFPSVITSWTSMTGERSWARALIVILRTWHLRASTANPAEVDVGPRRNRRPDSSIIRISSSVFTGAG